MLDCYYNKCRAAAAKWRAGKLLLSATLPGHTGSITCIASLQHLIATGSSDCSARVWDLQAGRQLQLLQHAEPLVAVALPSVSLCVTATAKSAHLWRQGKAVRRFDVTPVSVVPVRIMRLHAPSDAGRVVHSSCTAVLNQHCYSLLTAVPCGSITCGSR
jgi:WD40 repeat protein